MVNANAECDRLFLQTLGGTALLSIESDGSSQPLQLRRKDLALLIVLCVEGKSSYKLSWLATMLWGEWSDRTRRCTVQSLTRLRTLLPQDALVPAPDRVDWSGGLRSDIRDLEGAIRGGDSRLPTGVFLVDFSVGKGSAGFELWADGRRSRYRKLLLDALEQRGRAAEDSGAWQDALRLGQAAVETDPIDEPGHRRIMRSWSALGERGLALQHYRAFRKWAQEQLGDEPEPETVALARELGSGLSAAAEASRIDAERWAASPAQQFALAGEPAPAPAVSRARPQPSRRVRAVAAALVVVVLTLAGLPPTRASIAALRSDRAPTRAGLPFVSSPARPSVADLEVFLACVGWLGSAADEAREAGGSALDLNARAEPDERPWQGEGPSNDCP